MHTLLSQFCADFESDLRPILDPLDRASRALSDAQRGVSGREVLPQLLDMGHQLRALVDKVAEQQAYVLIFGPLKSGKSTLMNAVSAAYVSEVTSLPAYPCMVYVSHSEALRFVVTRYDGTTQNFTDPTALRMEIERAHGELAARIREVEALGEDFDPAIHFATAIRRVDVKVPAGELEQSGAVLVDTPGLYSRMKFGYDRMTREFRNAAACAIFVVKSDNLFLEQVFTEFNELLELFGRIFLVVNLDAGKRDLKPDGSLAPSLEREDPIRIIQAFQDLAMSAPLRAAYDEGRLRIYPVDLLHAASRRLRDARGDAADEGSEPAFDGQANFGSFLADLTEYLNSTEYLVSFLGDSLRRAGSLLSELGDLTRHASVRGLAREVDDLERTVGAAEKRREALERLATFRWDEAFAEFQRSLVAATSRRALELEGRTAEQLDAALAAWFDGDESVQGLRERELAPLVHRHRLDLARTLHGELEERVRRGAAGLDVPFEVADDLRTADVHLDELGRSSLGELRPDALEAERDVPLGTDDIPVKRSAVDWVLFRPAAAVRRSLFGPAEHPVRTLPRAVKAKRLGKDAFEAMRAALAGYRAEAFPRTSAELSERILGDYAQTASAGVTDQLDRERAAVTERLTEARGRLDALGGILERLRELEARTTAASTAVDGLSERYGRTEPIHLLEPFAPEAAAASASEGNAGAIEAPAPVLADDDEPASR